MIRIQASQTSSLSSTISILDAVSLLPRLPSSTHKMFFGRIILPLLAAASSVVAQGDLLGLLDTQPNLSTLRNAVKLVDLNATLSEASNITIVAPTNTAFEELLKLNVPESWALGNQSIIPITALLQNHVFGGYYPSSAIGEVPTFAQTLLTSELEIQRQLFTGITGGQYNGLVRNNGNVEVLSGEITVSTVLQAVCRHIKPSLMEKA
jgi:hypothetical protein